MCHIGNNVLQLHFKNLSTLGSVIIGICFPVDSRAVSEGNGGSDVSSDSPSAGVIAGVVVAVTVVCAALAVLVVIAVVYLAQTKRPQIVNR